MAEKILVVDDEKELCDLVSLYLKSDGYEVLCCCNAKEALEIIENEPIDLAILDIMLPEIDGLSILERIRSKHLYPVIMLSAKSEPTDKIAGLALGADDYITKPFLPLELVARVKAQLRRYKNYSRSDQDLTEEGLYFYKGLVLNTKSHTCSLNEKPLKLTPTEFSLLEILFQNKGKVISSEELHHKLWKDEYFIKNSSSISVHIRHLREKMQDSFEHPKYIKTVWGVGYKIE